MGATKEHPYKAKPNQLEMTLIHMDAELAFNESKDEFG